MAAEQTPSQFRFANRGKQLQLTQREIQCLKQLADGLTNEGIARSLGITKPTVALHVLNARKKMGARTRTQAVAIAVETGLIHPEATTATNYKTKTFD